MRDQFEIAIMCALPLEADAVQALFDDHWEHDELKELKALGDNNYYSFGTIGKHSIVLVHMPGMGTISGAIVAKDCRASFPNLKLALVVGVCGGVPFDEKRHREIILGDVVISEGIVGALGRTYPEGFERKNTTSDNFGRPIPGLRGLLSKLKTLRGGMVLKEQTCKYLETLRQAPGLGNKAINPGVAEDQLFEATYSHKHHGLNVCDVCSSHGSIRACEKSRTTSCQQLFCDRQRLVSRKRRKIMTRGSTTFEPTSTTPAIHFGLVASGDQVMKSGEHRDKIAAKEGVIAFEMEAAGVWDILPCLVIKGVCDYADSHKNKKWQDYAAATAAACAKAFLREW
ncbi:hypothetical protein CCHL11_09646 [Colletotrichum chlorophyti]|uniref:Nucleoside phosphorylase domain-containing protein n=1 Tax=Colletotrichum chlorophyti TaxID=708187 RepID=A0A1Q8RFG9_9PEZI|nr:hypothetical protein CCHL11_09646 [Colletotrichum chlorophyti]